LHEQCTLYMCFGKNPTASLTFANKQLMFVLVVYFCCSSVRKFIVIVWMDKESSCCCNSSFTITITSKFCIAPPTTVDESTSQKNNLKYNIKHKAGQSISKYAALNKKSLEMFLECQEGGELTNVSWQLIPGLRSNNWERSGTEGHPWTWYVKVALLCWTKVRST